MRVKADLNHLIPRDVVANLKFKAKVHKLVMDDPSLADVFIEACANDPIFFISGFCWTFDSHKEPFSRIPFILYEYQEEAILEILAAINDHDILIEKSRQMGISWLNLAAFVWILLFAKDRNGLLGSRTEDLVEKSGDAKALMWRVDYLVDNLPVWLRKGYNTTKHRHPKHIEYPGSGCSIDAESTTANFGTGDHRYYVFLDEFSKVPNGDSMLASTQPVTKSRIINGTPFGINNAFYDLTHHSRIKKLRLHWTIHPVYNMGLYHKEDGKYVAVDTAYWDKIENPEEKMEEYDSLITERGVPLPDSKERSPWYALECARALSAMHVAQELDINYLGSGGQFFNAEAVMETIRKYAKAPDLVGDLEYDQQTGEPIKFRENPKGRLRLWFTLDQHGKPEVNPEDRVALGCDIAGGSGASNSTGCAWNERTCKKLCEFASPHVRPEAFARQMVALAKWLNNAQLIWELNGVGNQFWGSLKEIGYNNIYMRTDDKSITGKVSNTPGYPSNKDSKQALLGQYRDVIETSECVNYSKEALEECLAYIFTPDGSIEHSAALNTDDPSGARKNHGDRAMGDALAWKLLNYRKVIRKKEKPKILYGSLAWRMEQRKKQNQKSPFELSEAWRS